MSDEHERDEVREKAKAATQSALSSLKRAGQWLVKTAKAGTDAVHPDVWTHAADLPLIALTLLTPRQRALDFSSAPDDGFPPLLLVHGLGGNAGNFLPLRAYLLAQGRRRAWAVELPPNCTIEALGNVLADTLEAAARVHKQGVVDVVAHSLGGLVARAALLELDRRRAEHPDAPPVSVRTLVTLGTPHTGSHLARYANTPTTRDLRPGSEILARLDAQLPWSGPPSQPTLVALWTKSDVIILPPENATAEGAKNVEFEGLSHNGLLLSPRAWEAVFEGLETGRVAAGAGVAHLDPPR